VNLFCVICRLADDLAGEGDDRVTVYAGMALCRNHFDEIAKVEDLDAVERHAVEEHRRVVEFRYGRR
jgi:hypothetical protein